MNNDLEAIVRTRVDDAHYELEQSYEAIRKWRYNRHQQAIWRNHAKTVKCVLKCIEIEEGIAADAIEDLSKCHSMDSIARREMLIAHHLLFGLVDLGAWDLKTRLRRRLPNEETFLKICRLSMYLHARVVKIVQASELLTHFYGSRIADMAELLDRAMREEGEIFVAHASDDKRMVLDVMDAWAGVGRNALGNIDSLIKSYAETPTDLAQIQRKFDSLHTKLDTLSLRTWIDVQQMIPGDAADELIDRVIKDARVLLVFFTPRYEDAWYLRNKETPAMRKDFVDRRAEGLRAIPVVLCANTWDKYRQEWIARNDTLTCPVDLKGFGPNAGPDDLRESVILALSDDRLLTAIIGDPKELEARY